MLGWMVVVTLLATADALVVTPLRRGAIVAAPPLRSTTLQLVEAADDVAAPAVDSLVAAPAADSFEGAVVPTGAPEPPESPQDPIATVFGALFPGSSNKKIWFGVLQKDVDPSDVPSEAERARRRSEAAKALTNIDQDERDRRLAAGVAMSAATLALAIGLLAGHAPAPTRFAIAPPLFLSYGYVASWRAGL